MTSIAERLLTADEFQDLAEDPEGRRMELLDGRVISTPHPGEQHADAAATIYDALRPFVAAHGLGKVRFDVGFQLRAHPDRVVAPDVGFIAHERLDPGRDPVSFFRVAPTLAIEVVSPNDTDKEVHDKVLEYLEAGSDRAWVVRPRSRTVTVHRPNGDAHTYTAADTLTSDDAGFSVPGFSLAVADIFAG